MKNEELIPKTGIAILCDMGISTILYAYNQVHHHLEKVLAISLYGIFTFKPWMVINIFLHML